MLKNYSFLSKTSQKENIFNRFKKMQTSSRIEFKEVLLQTNSCQVDLYQSFLNFFLKKGKKISIKSLIDRSFLNLSLKLNCSQHFILLKFFQTVNTFVEVKKVRIRRKIFFVPFALSRQRRIHTALKWLLLAIQSNKSPLTFEEKLTQELTKIFLNQSCTTLTLLKKNNKLAIVNRSNVHYRW